MRSLVVLLALRAVAAQNLLSDEQMAAGERQARDFRRHTKALPGAAEEYLRRLGRQVLPAGAHWEFELIQNDVKDPTRAPVVFPGYVFVPARLLLMTGSEAELAGMLAYSVARRIDGSAVERRAVEMAASAGFDPRVLAEYLRRVQSAGGLRGGELAARIAAVEEAASAVAPREWKAANGAFADAQEFARLYGTKGRRPRVVK